MSEYRLFYLSRGVFKMILVRYNYFLYFQWHIKES